MSITIKWINRLATHSHVNLIILEMNCTAHGCGTFHHYLLSVLALFFSCSSIGERCFWSVPFWEDFSSHFYNSLRFCDNLLLYKNYHWLFYKAFVLRTSMLKTITWREKKTKLIRRISMFECCDSHKSYRTFLWCHNWSITWNECHVNKANID